MIHFKEILLEHLQDENEKINQRRKQINKIINDVKIESSLTEKDICDYIFAFEKDYLDARKLYFFVDENDEENKNIFDEDEVVYDNQYHFNEETLKIKLPFLIQKKTGSLYKVTRQYLHQVVQNIAKKIWETENIPLYYFDNSIIIFEHHISKDSIIPDADNMDVKVVIDALNGIFFSDDNLKNLPFMQVYVSEKTDNFTTLIIHKNPVAIINFIHQKCKTE